MKRLSLYICAALGICVVVAVLAFPWAAPALNKALYSEKPFDSEAWKAGSVRQRARMAGDLEGSGILLGTSRVGVISLLGPPDFGSADGSLGYRIIRGDIWDDVTLDIRPFAAWCEHVQIEFDQNGRVNFVQRQD
jgi:hypothetical protein